jgi:hypothetical protein
VSCKVGTNIGKGIDHGGIVIGGHGSDKDSIEVIDVRNKNLLHGLEGVDREGSWCRLFLC